MMNTVKTQMKFRKALKKLPKMDMKQVLKYMKKYSLKFVSESSFYDGASFACFVKNEDGDIRFLEVKTNQEHREKIRLYKTEYVSRYSRNPSELIRECNLYW